MKKHNSAGGKRVLLSSMFQPREKTAKNRVADVFVVIVYVLIIIMVIFTMIVFSNSGINNVGYAIIFVVLFATMVFLFKIFLVLFFILSTIASIMCWGSEGFLNAYSLLYIATVVFSIVAVILDRKKET